MTDADIDTQWDLHVLRVQMTDGFLQGTIDPETYFDFMAQQGYEPEQLMDDAEENLQFAIQKGLKIEK
ncbi:hypothetical protein [Myxacorys almedinensis]|uniref:Uncharacterized protein n=1 Tax=Myxacorys almedinensis A TaxID=2690445 RepID=A0A8J7YYB8_9CYAN|nr:hypothetical protein [Myxacorys almedinensis]NDJ16784.1 hypothetical protein [Myxacorys almedinensis A]